MSNNGDAIDTGGFAKRAKDTVEAAGDASGILPDASDIIGGDVPGPVKRVGGRLIRPSGDGQSVDEIQDALGCGEGPAYAIRGLERATGIEDVPPVAEMAIGVLKTARGE